MKSNRSMKITALSLIILPLLAISMRFWGQEGTRLGVTHKFHVTYEYTFEKGHPYKVKSYLPGNNIRQQIGIPAHDGIDMGLMYPEDGNRIIEWKGQSASDSSISYQFTFEGKSLRYNIRPSIPYYPYADGYEPFLSATELIQSDHPKIVELALELSREHESLVDIIAAFYTYVYDLPAIPTSELTDALMALENGEASCNGKSRLFVALCRSIKIPARVTGGLILEETIKKTSHLWAEVNIEGQWVPFDALNGHFAALPAHYLELYKGDHFLITRNKSLPFDYQYVIRKERLNDFAQFALINIYELADEASIPVDLFKVILLLPVGAFLVAIFKNIIGLKTFGVFLPVLIAIAWLDMGLIPGIILLTILIAVVGTLNYPMEKWGIQFNSKISVMLIAVVLVAILSVKLLHQTGWLPAAAPLFFPIIILTITSERVARKIEEEGLRESFELYGTTLLAALLVYLILASQTIQQFLLTFPEVMLSIAGINLLLGKWIGLRVLEYRRFSALMQ